MRPPATGRPARTNPHSPRALDPVDAATHAPGPGLGPRAALPASRGSGGPQGAPDGHADTLARAPPAAWRAPAWRHALPGRPPLPMRPARAATPRRLCRAAARTQGTGTGTREQHLNRTQHASDSEPMFVLLCSRPCALPPP